ncbi:MAG: DNA polymerase III subunit gamma/tau [Patescibacteria group bacterium]
MFSRLSLLGAARLGENNSRPVNFQTANCRTRQTDAAFAKLGEPCNHCAACAEIDRGQALDVVEIDAASNRGIDEIRNLKESVRLSPTSFPKKIFIIDECHMLTKEAFNALLKTLEEPPEHVIFILATTEFEKIPATIVSRTQQFHFKKIPLMRIFDKLKKIAKSEKMEISTGALELIAASAEGSFRDAESLLDQLLSFGYQKIGVDEVEGMVGKVAFSKTASFAESLLIGQIDKTLKELAEIEDDGYNLVQFNKDLIHYLRKVLVLKFEPSLEKAFKDELTPEALERLKSHAQLIKEKHLELLKALIGAYGQMRYSQFPIIPLEVAIIESLKIKN